MKEKLIEIDKIQRIVADEIISLDRQYYGVEPDRALAKMEAYQAAEKLYEAGYRKQSEIAREIFEEIDIITLRYLDNKDYSTGEMVYDIDKLKEKYVKGGEG